MHTYIYKHFISYLLHIFTFKINKGNFGIIWFPPISQNPLVKIFVLKPKVGLALEMLAVSLPW